VQKFRVLSILVACTLIISDENHLEEKKSHLPKVFENNSYSKTQNLEAFQRSCKESRVNPAHDDHISKVQLSFIQGTADRTAHILKKNRVYASFKPLNTIRNYLRYVKDPVDPKDIEEVYSITCSYGFPYIGEIGCSINQRI